MNIGKRICRNGWFLYFSIAPPLCLIPSQTGPAKRFNFQNKSCASRQVSITPSWCHHDDVCPTNSLPENLSLTQGHKAGQTILIDPCSGPLCSLVAAFMACDRFEYSLLQAFVIPALGALSKGHGSTLLSQTGRTTSSRASRWPDIVYTRIMLLAGPQH